MSISTETIASIQRAGEALNTARQALADASQEQASRVTQALSHNPFGLENDAHFEQWKSIARMAQTLQQMEDQLKNIFHEAGTIALEGPGSGADPARRLPKPLQLRDHSSMDLGPSDVRAKAARTGKGSPKKPGQAKKPVRKAGKTVATAGALKGNAGRVMAFLQTRLSRDGFGRVTHAEIASGSPIPTGSVGAALSGLMSKGVLIEGERGSYKLG